MEQSFSTPDRLREAVSTLERLPTGVTSRAAAILVLLGKKLATDFPVPADAVEATVSSVEEAGLAAAVLGRGDVQSRLASIAVARDQEALAALLNVRGTRAVEDHRRYGELVGFPKTAIDAFLREGGAEPASEDSPEAQLLDMPRIAPTFSLSKDHAVEEVAVLEDWERSVYAVAPRLADELFDSGTAAAYHARMSRQK